MKKPKMRSLSFRCRRALNVFPQDCGTSVDDMVQRYNRTYGQGIASKLGIYKALGLVMSNRRMKRLLSLFETLELTSTKHITRGKDEIVLTQAGIQAKLNPKQKF